ncbi:MAG: aspartate aminotransferase family protein [Proteobacteria bacterium]|nr:aspartate aminotransferase family protein [Pseudomonadota bacterium]
MNAVMPNYGNPTVSFERGEGAYLFDTDGRRYLDFAAGIAVNSLGHSHPALVKALKDQAERLWHVSNLYAIPDQIRMAERLCALSFAEGVFFCNSGTEAMEGSIKVARRFHAQNGHPEKWRSITLEGSFHGRTIAMLAASKNPKHLAGFGDPVDGFDIVPVHNMNALRDAITPQTAAIVAEPIQGEGGLRPLEDAYLRDLRATADEFGLLLVFDEVQTGFGRTGKLFAHEWSGVTPDVMACAKGIAGGFPCGAVLATEAVASVMTAGSHGSTFGGNPLAMAVANATLDVLTSEGFLDNVIRSGETLRAGLRDIAGRHADIITDVRGKGLMVGIVVAPEFTNAQLGGAARDAGLLTVVAGENVLRMLPPLIIGESEIAEALDAIEQACTALASAGDA